MALSSPGSLEWSLLAGRRCTYPAAAPVKAVAPGAEIAGVLPVQGLGAEGAAQETFHGIASFSMDEMGQRDTMVLTSSGGLSLMRQRRSPPGAVPGTGG